MGEKEIAIVDELGKVGTLPESQAKKALLDGTVKLATDQQFKKEQRHIKYGEGLAAPVIAAGAGVLRGATGGLSDAAAVGLTRTLGSTLYDDGVGLDAAQGVADDLRGYREENEIASIAGELPGMVVGGAGKLMGAAGRTVGGLATKGIGGALGKVAGGALAGGTELGLYSGSNELSRELTEEALGNHALNAEHIGADAAHGFLMGAAFGGALGLGGALKDSVSGRIFSRGRSLEKEAVAAQQAAQAEEAMAAQQPRMVANADAQAASAAGAEARAGGAQNMGVDVSVTPGSTTGPSLLERGGKVKSVLEGVTAGTPYEKLAKEGLTAESIINFLDDASAESVIKGAGKRIRSVRTLNEAYKEGGAIGAGKYLREELPRVLGKKNFAEITNPEEMYRGSEILRKEIGAKMDLTEGLFATKEAKAAIPKMTLEDVHNQIEAKMGQELRKFGNKTARMRVDGYKDEMFTSLGADAGVSASEVPVSLPQLRQLSKDISEAMGEKNDAVMKRLRQEIEGMVDRRVEVIGTATKDPALLARYRGEKQQYLAAKEFGKIAKEGAAQQVNNAFGGVPGVMMGGITGLAGAMVAGPLGALTGAAGQLGIAALRRRSPQLAAHYFRREFTTELAKNIGALGRENSAALKDLLTTTTTTAPTVNVKMNASQMFGTTSQARAASIAKASAALDSGAIGERVATVTAPIATNAPNIAREIATTMGRAAAFLKANAPQPTTSSLGLAPWASQPTYRDEDVQRWAQQWRVVSDWRTVINSAKNGTITSTEVDTLKAVYPKKFEAMRTEFMGLLFEPETQKKANKLPLDKRLAIVTLFDIPTPLTEPGFVGAVQEGIAEQGSQQTPSDQAPQNARRGDAQQALSASDAMRTDTERLSHGAGSD